MPQIELVLAVGHYAQRWHLGQGCPKSMTETVRNWRRYAKSNSGTPRIAAAASELAQYRLAPA